MKFLRFVLVAFPCALAALFLIVLGLAMAGRLERTVEARGEVQVRHYQVVRPQLSGFVREILVEPGDQVTVGDFLVRLEDPELQRQLAEARRRLLEVEIELERGESERQSTLERSHPLERERQHQAVVGSELDARLSTSLRREAELVLEAKRQRLEQSRSLQREGLVSDQQVREREQEVLVADERLAQRVLDEERTRYGIPESRRSLELLQVEQQRRGHDLDARLRQLRAELSLWQREVTRLETLEGRQVLRATLDGVVVGEPNNDLLDRFLAPGDELFQVIDPQSIRFVSQVPEEAMVRVRSGQQAQIELVGLPKNHFDTFAGQVERVSQLAIVADDTLPGYTVDLHIDRPWVRLAEGPFLLRGGMRGTAQIAYRHDVPVLSVFYEFLAGKPQVPDSVPPDSVRPDSPSPDSRRLQPRDARD